MYIFLLLLQVISPFSTVEAVVKCGRVINDTMRGVIEWPNNPLLNVKEKVHCSWVIEAPRGYFVNLSIRSLVTLFSPECGSNFLLIQEHSHTLVKLCGNYMQHEDIRSSKSTLSVDFHFDGGVKNVHFVATYNIQKQGAYNLCPKITYSNTSGNIQSPNFPGYYPINQDCVWIIEGGAGSKIFITFLSWEMADDHLVIRDGPNSTSRVIGELRGKTDYVESSGSYLYIQFKSNQELVGRGFYGEYKIVEEMTTPRIKTTVPLQSKTTLESKATKTTIITTTTNNPKPCKTKSGTSCMFPFIYKKVKYNSCTASYNNGTAWCPTSVYKSGEAKAYEECSEDCETEKIVEPQTCKTMRGFDCLPKFMYFGVQHNGCITLESDKAWCSVTNFNGTDEVDTWGFCNSACDVEPAYSGNECITTANQKCIFPFTYNGKNYKKCTNEGHRRLWCATSTFPGTIIVKGWNYCMPSNINCT